MAQYIVKFSGGSAPGRHREIFDSLQAAQSFAVSHGLRNKADTAAAYEVDKDGNEIGEPHLVKF